MKTIMDSCSLTFDICSICQPTNYPFTFVVDEEFCKRVGANRQKIHTKNTTPRFFNDPNIENIIGIKTEIAFSRLTNLEVDWELYENGDGKIDFSFPKTTNLFSVDVKGARKPIYLFLKEKDAPNASDYLVLAKVENQKISFLGWETKETMLACPVKDFGYGIHNHYLDASKLQPMQDLIDFIKFVEKNSP